jgi:CO/xanthine dehydrogenase FAD-binding subunit
MPKVVGYHRPSSLGEALELLAEPGSVALAGGTVVNADRRGDPVVAVDLQALGLAGVTADGRRARIGAMTTLQQLADSAVLPDGIRMLSRRELPSTLRTLATVGGTVAAGGPDSGLLAALLVHDAVVHVAGDGEPIAVPLAALLADRAQLKGRLIVAIEIAVDGAFAHDATARTPGDDPIVAACARRTTDGTVRLALTGVAPTPVLVDDVASLQPPGDFRGTTEYRQRVAGVLAARVRDAVQR